MVSRLLAAAAGISIAFAACPAARAESLIDATSQAAGGCGSTAIFTPFAPRGAGPPACWRPYAADSPWNRPLPPDPTLAPASAAIVDRLTGWGSAQAIQAGHADTPGDYDHPLYFSRPTDPIYTLHATRPWGRAEIEGARIHIPAQARPAGGGDAHLGVVTPDGWEYDLWTVSRKRPEGGRLVFGWGGRTRIDGDGLGSNATAAHFGTAAGEIRAPELEAGEIRHALFMGVRCTDSKRSSVYPAAAGTGEPCTDLGLPDRDAPPLGTRFFLDLTDAQIDALAVPPWKRTILRAIARYGMIVGDRFGSGAWGLQMESGSTYTSFGLPDRVGRFAAEAGATPWRGGYLFDLQDGVDWRRYLRVADPCVSRGSC